MSAPFIMPEPAEASVARALHDRRALYAAFEHGLALGDAIGLSPAALDLVDEAIEFLDEIDAPNEDREPSLGAPEQDSVVALDGRLHRYFGKHWIDRSNDQSRWGRGPASDLEEEHDGAEPDDPEEEDDFGEDGGDAELTAIENAGRGFYGVEADDAEDDGADEPLLGAPENHPSCPAFSHLYRSREGRQTLWGQGRNDALNDGEPEAGYDEPEGDDERCASDDVHGEYSLGWTANVSQVSLYTERERWGGDELEVTAVERHGRGFVRSGPDDSEDSDPGEDDGTGEPSSGAWEGGIGSDQTRWSSHVSLPSIYALRVEGGCCMPLVSDGARVLVDAEAPIQPGDLVAIHHDDPKAESGLGAKLKMLADPLPSNSLPMIKDLDFRPLISARMLNPPRRVFYDLGTVHAVHKVIEIQNP